jgi:type IV pilus biogenesis protein CpaD/CtpE
MQMTLSKTLLIPALLALGLAGCVESRAHLGSDFGAVVNQNLVAQIADPDARYPQEVVSDGARVGLAMERYRTGKTIPPSDVGASKIGAASDGQGAGANPK